ncbi:retropepsin-like aspartic protease [uncultured Dokdonia sp.]|uniref:retropepsin-like aspartic protease n=1 Tax=uncultured Dokdonia sp. TaxID=575653 RepID=UPI00262F4E1B|nr:retropepsin-like aspartic protease [uncultured Dokdonia sp.]
MKVFIIGILYSLCIFFSINTLFSQDTIPITIGTDNRIYLKVTVNGSEELDFIFDTGASAMVANTTQTDKKLNLNYNNSVENTGANGVSTQKVSAGNTIQIGSFKRENEELIGIEYPEKHYSFDGVIGYPFFEDFLMEIDYESQIIVVHRSKNTIANRTSYEKVSLDFMNALFYMDMTVFKKEKPVQFPVMIDTGFNGDLIVYHKTVSEKGLANQFEKIRNSRSEGTDGTVIESDLVIIPKVILAKTTLQNTEASLNLTPTSTAFTAILGGNIMKHFHWIFDYKKRQLYIRPN